MNKKYKKDSFGDRAESLKSAKVIVPILLEIYKPRSVVDVGCGTGEFLSVFRERGIKNVLGIDGPWINEEKLRIPKDCFMPRDLEKPIKISERFDLAVSLEVAEHLSQDSACEFVKTLTDLAPVILFSAAVPFQGGLHHVNEQWPEYWVKLFAQRGYVPIDSIRKKIWNNEEVCFWYSQNILLFVKKEYLQKNKKLKKEFEQTGSSVLALVHPKLYLVKAEKLNSISKFIPGPLKGIIIKVMNSFK
ncbi:MAG: methyltransferase domain-containing protein [Candidatus Woesearchaeota archaeon]